MGGGHNRQQRGRSAPKREKQTPRRSSPLRVNLLVYAVTLLLCIAQGHTTVAGARQRASVRPAAVRAAQAKARTVHPKAGPMATKRQLTQCATHQHEHTTSYSAESAAKCCKGAPMPRSCSLASTLATQRTPPPASRCNATSKALLPPRIMSIERSHNQ